MTTTLITSYRLERDTERILVHDDQVWARQAGIERERLNRQRRCWTPMVDDLVPAQMHERNGCGAEIAFARLVGVRPVLIKEKWVGEPNGWLPNGRPYRTFAAPPGGQLLARAGGNPKRAWIYVLFWVEWPIYRYMGWIDGELLIRRERLLNLKGRSEPRGWSYGARVGHLRGTLEYW